STNSRQRCCSSGDWKFKNSPINSANHFVRSPMISDRRAYQRTRGFFIFSSVVSSASAGRCHYTSFTFKTKGAAQRQTSRTRPILVVNRGMSVKIRVRLRQGVERHPWRRGLPEEG